MSHLLLTCVVRVQCFEGEASAALIDSYKLGGATMAKRLWRLAVEHHAFFRRVDQFSFVLMMMMMMDYMNVRPKADE